MQLLAALIASVSFFALDTLRRLIKAKREKKGLPLPPGPAQLPLLGNAYSINIEEPWKTYTEWHSKYGDVIYLRLLDQHVVVLGSQSVAVELLEKRSRTYSDRPFTATVKPYGGECNFVFAHYGDHWRLCRRIFHQTFRSESILNFRLMQLRCARQLVISIADSPDQYNHHYSTFSVSVAMLATYDYKPSLQDDPLVQIIEEYAALSARSFTPEKSVLIKLFPFLLHIPNWFPGSWLKREANYAYNLSLRAVELPYQYAKTRMEASYERQTFSMVSDNLSRVQELDESKRAEYISCLKTAAVTSVFASEETTSSILMTFILTMVLHPHVWKRAQAEIDEVIGKNRLPEFNDRPALPYVEAIIRETFRWHPVTPHVVHATSDSDVYDGFYIPKGAAVIANTWAMTRDEIRYPNPDAFIPERFINKDGTLNDDNPAHFVFGFGRRICPGRYLADSSFWTAMVTLLSTVEFKFFKDAQGNDITFEPKWLNGLVHRPDEFPCQLSLRPHVNKSFLERALVD